MRFEELEDKELFVSPVWNGKDMKTEVAIYQKVSPHSARVADIVDSKIIWGEMVVPAELFEEVYRLI